MKGLSLIFAVLLSSSVFGQFSLSGGTNLLKGFNTDKPYVGLHIGFEVPRDDAFTIYGRYSHFFKNYSTTKIQPTDFGAVYIEPRDPLSGLWGEYIGATPAMNYNVLEGGSRYYIGDGFDDGFGAYGGTNIMVIFNKVTYLLDDYNKVDYRVVEPTAEGSFFSLGFGLGGGVKYTIDDIGTFYFDVNGSYLILARANKTTYVYDQMISGLLFTFNFGYRYDIVWD